MKKILLIIPFLFSLSVFGQTYNPVTQRQDFQNDVKFTKTSPVVPWADAVNKAVPLGQLNSLLGLYLFKTDTAAMLSHYPKRYNPLFYGIIKLNTDTAATKAYARSLIGGSSPDLTQYRKLNNHDSLSTLKEKSYNSLTDKPTIPDVTGFKQKNDSIIKSGYSTNWEIQHKIDSLSALKANVSHTQAQSTITGLVDSLLARYTKTQADNKFALISHNQAQSTITALADSLLARYTKTQADGRFAPLSHTQAQSTITALSDSLLARYTKSQTNTLLAGKIDTVKRGQANGVASLDVSGKVPLSQINDALIGSVNYQGTYNANTNTPALPTASTHKGWYYVCSVNGINTSTVLASGDSLRSGDWTISNGTSWLKLENNNFINTVFGRRGNITATSGDYTTDQVTEGTNKYDKTVALSNGTGINVTGTYPNFTITNSSPSSGGTVTSVATGLGLSGGTITTSGTLLVDTANVSVLSRQRAANTYQTKLGFTPYNSTNPNGYTSNTGTVTSITKGLGMVSGDITTTGSVAIDTANVSILSRQRAVNTYQLKGSYLTASDITGKVPYTGATGAVDLGAYGLTANSLYFGTAGSSGYMQFHNKAQTGTLTLGSINTSGSEAVYDFSNVGTFSGGHALLQPTTDIPQLYLKQQNANVGFTVGTTNDGLFRIRPISGVSDAFTMGTDGTASFIGNLTANSFFKSGGTSSQFLKADGSVDGSTYLTSQAYPGAGIPLSTGTAWGTSITNNSGNWNTAYGAINGLTSGYIPKSTGGGLANSLISDDGSNLFLNGGGTFSTTSKGISFQGLSSDYKIGFDNAGGTVGYIRHNIVNSGTDTWGHIFSHSSYGSPDTFVNDLFIGASGTVRIPSTTTSTSSTTGALVVGGGVGIGGTLTASGAITAPNLVSGTYTPTIVDSLNITSHGFYDATYSRLGNIVHCQITGYVTPTIGSTSSALAFSLPIATTLGASHRFGHGIFIYSATTTAGMILSVTGTHAMFQFTSPVAVGSGSFSLQFDYSL